MTEIVGLVIAAAIGVGFTLLAVIDYRTLQVPVRHARRVAYGAIAGLTALSAMTGDWDRLIQACVGSTLVACLQALPYLWQQRRPDLLIGRADLRLAFPFGFTLGWFGLGFVVVGFTAALLTGLAYAAGTRKVLIPFVPAMSIGYWFALTWAVVVLP